MDISPLLGHLSVQVRENAAEELKERQRDWATVVLAVWYNMAFVGVVFVVLGLSMEEIPSAPLRLWVLGYVFQRFVHIGCVVAVYWQRREVDLLESNSSWESGIDSNSGSDGYGDDYATDHGEVEDDSRVSKHLEFANSMFSFFWWIIGLYWVTADGQSLTSNSPRLYWLCITFLAFDVGLVMFYVAFACLLGIAVCCCLPCITALPYVVEDRVVAKKEDIDRLPKFKFQTLGEYQKVKGVIESFGGIMTECDTSSPTECALSDEDVECCICFSAYDNGAELRELPCLHHFHRACIDQKLKHIEARCPLCKFNILKHSNRSVSGV